MTQPSPYEAAPPPRLERAVSDEMAVDDLSPTSLLERAYALAPVETRRTAARLIIEWVDRKCLAGSWEDIDAALAAADLNRLAPTSRLAFVTMTRIVKEVLPSRPAYLEAARTITAAEDGAERADRIYGPYA